jgi:cytochrome c2
MLALAASACSPSPASKHADGVDAAAGAVPGAGAAAYPVRSPVAGPVAHPSQASGKALLAEYGCVSCHSIKGFDTPPRTAGPPLGRIADNSYVGGLLPNTAGDLARWIMHPRQVSPGTAMPELGVTAEQARDMVAYLYAQ